MRFIKKHKYKLLTLMLSIVSIFTLFLGINKTYAYETDQITYTISSITDQNNNVVSPITVDNKTGYVYNASNYNEYFSFGINVSSSANVNFAKCYLMFNYYLYDGINIQNYDNSNSSVNIRFFYNNGNANTYVSLGTLRNNSNMYNSTNNNYYTFIGVINIANTLSITNRRIYLNISGFSYGFLITNIDVVPFTDIGLQQYYDTYYGQIEDNYNALLSDYNDLQDNYDTLEGNYNTLEDNYDTLEGNYNTLEGNYNTLEDDYNQLQQDYESLDDNYDGLRDDYNSLQDDYETLQENYNSLNTEYNQSNMYNQYGALAYINNLDVYSQGPTTNFTFEQLTQNEFIIGGNKLYLSKIIENTGYYGNNYIDIYFNPNLYLSLLKFNLSTEQSYPSTIVFGINRNDTYYTTITINLQNYNGALIDYDYLLTFDSTLLDNDTISEISIESVGGTDFDRVYMIFTNLEIVSYNNGFNNGYQKGVEHQQRVITDLNNQITILTSRVTNLEYLNQALNEQINSFNSDYNLNNLMWTIASTPFDSFKQIWNVDFFGVNISSVITGFLTGIIVLWIIKKFFL